MVLLVLVVVVVVVVAVGPSCWWWQCKVTGMFTSRLDAHAVSDHAARSAYNRLNFHSAVTAEASVKATCVSKQYVHSATPYTCLPVSYHRVGIVIISTNYK